MSANAEKRKALESILGPDLAAKYLATAEVRSKAVETLGVKFKEVDNYGVFDLFGLKEIETTEAIEAKHSYGMFDFFGLNQIKDSNNGHN